MADIVKIEPPTEGEETLDNTQNVIQVIGFFCVLAALVGLVIGFTVAVGDMAVTILGNY